ncbi:MAG: zinc ribbon domain-containing protein [Spirochaetia bacterium]|nr:zinc ribbon domain-containing protein [Spirochaetia bacterium]
MKAKDVVFGLLFLVFESLAAFAYIKFDKLYIIALIAGGVLALLWILLRVESILMPSGKVCPACGAMVKHGAKFCGTCGARVKSSSPLSKVIDILLFRLM